MNANKLWISLCDSIFSNTWCCCRWWIPRLQEDKKVIHWNLSNCFDCPSNAQSKCIFQFDLIICFLTLAFSISKNLAISRSFSIQNDHIYVAVISRVYHRLVQLVWSAISKQMCKFSIYLFAQFLSNFQLNIKS